jgi:hypothetical protein
MTDTRPPPPIALRTYTALRLGMVAVLLGLGIALGHEIGNEGCVNKSISAYYYTPVHSVFVGALIALGLAMIALWGRTILEDICLNLAGMLAPVVAFVPTLDSTNCSLPPELTEQTDDQRKAQLIDANSPAVSNNFFTLLTVIAIALVFVAGVIIYRWRQPKPEWSEQQRAAYVKETQGYLFTWGVAVVVWIVGFIIYKWKRDDWFDYHAHWYSAVAMFVLVGGAVFAAGLDRLHRRETGWQKWLGIYWSLVLAMIAAAAFILLTAAWVWEGTWWAERKIFLLEAAEILLVAGFWLVQTVDRRKTGAPTEVRSVFA